MAPEPLPTPSPSTTDDAAARPFTVTIGVLTYQRPDSLITTLRSFRDRPTGARSGRADPGQPGATGATGRGGADDWPIHEVLVIDNDRLPSARDAVDSLVAEGYPHPVRYVHETSPGLAAARNRALDEAAGRVLVFIDDDEVAEAGWPDGLLTTMAATGAALVGGPVRTAFTTTPPDWVADGGFFGRAEPPDRSTQSWLRSGNLAMDLDAVRAVDLRFDPAFGFSGGEDVAFSRSAHRAGLELRWSATAPVVETVGPDRTTLRWLFQRELASTTNWVRVERAHDPSPARVALILARATARLTQGIMTALIGAVTLDSVRRSRGLVTVARGVGALRGLTTQVPDAYRTGYATPG